MSPTSGKSFELVSGGASDSESKPMGGVREGDSVAEAAVRFCFPGDIGVGDGAAAFAGGSEAVDEAETEVDVEAEAETEAEAEAEAEVEAEVEALLAAV